MRFWDSSAIVPLIADEQGTPAVEREYDVDSELAVWWATEVECLSAISRKERDGVIAGAQALAARSTLDSLASAWQEVEPSEALRVTARRLLRVHALRAADALQLAAAIAASEADPASLDLVMLDEQLAEAARREGFPVAVPA